MRREEDATSWGVVSCQELKELQQEERQSEEKTQPPLESQQEQQWPLGPPPAQPQPQGTPVGAQLPQRPQLAEQSQILPPPPPQPPLSPSPQNAQDSLTQCTSAHILQDSQRPGPQLSSVGAHQLPGQSNFNKFLQNPGEMPGKGGGEERVPYSPESTSVLHCVRLSPVPLAFT